MQSFIGSAAQTLKKPRPRPHGTEAPDCPQSAEPLQALAPAAASAVGPAGPKPEATDGPDAGDAVEQAQSRRAKKELRVIADPAAEIGLQWVPHARSLLEAAVRSSDEEVIRYTLQKYWERHQQCLQWQCYGGHGTWDPLPPGARPRPGDAVRCQFPTLFLYPQPDRRWAVTTETGNVPDWGQAAVLLASGDLALAARDRETLELLVVLEEDPPPGEWSGAVPPAQQAAHVQHPTPESVLMRADAGSPTAGMGCPLGRTWPMARAVALLCVDPTQNSETGTVWGLRWHNLPRERKDE